MLKAQVGHGLCHSESEFWHGLRPLVGRRLAKARHFEDNDAILRGEQLVGAIELHTAGTVQAHQRLALTSLSVANAKAVRLNVPLGGESA